MEESQAVEEMGTFAERILQLADEEGLNYEEVFTGLTQATASIILGYSAEGVPLEDVLEKFIGYLREDVKVFAARLEAFQAAEAEVPEEV